MARGPTDRLEEIPSDEQGKECALGHSSPEWEHMLETDSVKCVTLQNKDYRNMTSFYITSVQVYSDWCTVFEQIVNTRIYVHVFLCGSDLH